MLVTLSIVTMEWPVCDCPCEAVRGCLRTSKRKEKHFESRVSIGNDYVCHKSHLCTATPVCLLFGYETPTPSLAMDGSHAPIQG